MHYNKLLERQIRKYLPDECLQDGKLLAFIAAVHNSYQSYEKDQALSAHAFRISEQEYAGINRRLKEEVAIKRLGIKNLREAIKSIEGGEERPVFRGEEDDDLIETLVYLKEQIARRKRVETELHEYERLFRMAFEKLGDNVWRHDFQTGKTYFSNTENHFLGYSFTDITQIAKLWWDNILEEDRHILEENDRQYKSSDRDGHSLEYRMYHKDGSIRWVLDRGIVIEHFADGRPLKIIGTHTDITRIKRTEVELTEAREQADESSRAKELFLANMSHEIRTPMNGILGMSRQLQKTTLDKKQHVYLDTINSAAENLLVVINDILDISKIEAGKMQLEKIGFRMKDVLTRATRVMQHKAEEKGLRLDINLDERVYAILLGDPYRLNQVLLNLLSNAIKFTERGSITMDCLVHEQGADRQDLLIMVRDTGIGMDEEFLGHLFQKFSQEDRSVARKYGGTGLGMSICRQLTGLMGGAIFVESRKGEGTRISLTIPFEAGTESDLVQKDDTVTDSAILEGKKILLVEDNEMNRLVATTVLNNYGAEVFEAINGAEALVSLRAAVYDLVLMDVQMPVMDGLEATRIIRREIDARIPVIALTANAIKGENNRCIAAGMDDYITKPFEEEELIRMIARFLGRGGAAADAGNVAAVEEAGLAAETAVDGGAEVGASAAIPGKRECCSPGTAPLYDLAGLRQIGQGDAGFLQKMVQLFLTQVPAAIAEMKKAYVAGDFAALGAVAHRIKPVLDSMAIAGQPAGIKEIEALAKENRCSAALEEGIGKLGKTIEAVREDLAKHAW